MPTWENDVAVTALRNRGWSISAIARHSSFDRETVRKYLAGDGTPGVRARPGRLERVRVLDYVTARLIEDPHLWARTLYDELEELGRRRTSRRCAQAGSARSPSPRPALSRCPIKA
jgi:hypothetical protein